MLSNFNLRDLDKTKKGGGSKNETIYAQVRASDGVWLKTRYRDHGTFSQFGCGGDRTGRRVQKRAKKKTGQVNDRVVYVDAKGHRHVKREPEFASLVKSA